MATLTIGDRKVQIGDEFLKLSPADQQKTVDEIARQMGASDAQSPPAPDTATDVLKSAGAGLRSGAESLAGAVGDVRDINANAASWIAQKLGISPESAQKIANVVKFAGPMGPALAGASALAPTTSDVQSVTNPVMGKAYEPQTTAGKFSKTIASFLPAAALGPGRLATRIMTQAVIPGAASEAAGELAQKYAPGYEQYARIGGAFAGPIALSAARRAVTPFPSSPERIAQADVLAQEGVDLTAGQRTGSDWLRYMESELGGMAGQRMMEHQGEKFTRAALRYAGINAPRATPEVIDHAFTRIGNRFNDLAANTHIPFDQQLQNDMLGAVQDYQSVTGPSAQAPLIENIMNDAANLASRNNNVLSGSAYARLRTRINENIRRGDPNTQAALRDMQSALDDAVERNLPPQHTHQWQQARRQYRNLLVIERAATSASESSDLGILTPAALRSATMNQSRRAFARGQGDLAPLARAGGAVMRPLPNSGTAARTAARAIGNGLPATVGGILGGSFAGVPGGIAGAALGSVAGPAMRYATGRAMLSPMGRAYLSNQVLQNAPDFRGSAARAALAAILQQRVLGNGQ